VNNDPTQGTQQQPDQPAIGNSWSQVTSNIFNEGFMKMMFFAIVASLFIAYLLADREERNAHSSRPPKVSFESDES
jgi:hypothetical protein